MERAGRERLARAMRLAVAAALLATVAAGGCDWFDDPLEVNLPPETSITDHPQSSLVPPGSDVSFAWAGTDDDGSVVRYEWSLEEASAGEVDGGETAGTSITFEDIEEGSYTFSVAAIDDDGETDGTPATWQFTASLGDLVERVVLCELLTTKICPNCWKAELALERMLGEFGRANLCVVSYHYSPPPDPVSSQASIDRCDWYYADPKFDELADNFPSTIFDGLTYELGAADSTATKNTYRALISSRMAVGSPVSIELGGDIGSTRGSISATVRVHHVLEGGPYSLRLVLVEDEVFDGEEYFEFVARDMLVDQEIFVAVVGDSAVVTSDFSVAEWNAAHLDIIAFVQDDTSTEVLQSGRLLSE